MDGGSIVGPGWVDPSTSPYRGLNPIAVENYINSAVARHAYGVTTITSAARYYALQGALTSGIARGGLEGSDAAGFVRRVQVVYAMVCLAHARSSEHDASTPQPHGAANILRALADGPVDLDVLAGGDPSRRFAQRSWGFWDTYATVTDLFGITAGAEPGKAYDDAIVDDVFAGVIDLATSSRHLDLDEVAHLSDACLCWTPTSPDGQWLAEQFVGRPHGGSSIAAVIGETLQLLDGAIVGSEVRWPEDIANVVMYSDLVATHERSTRVWKHWQGIFLRAEQVYAWNALWSELSGILEASGAMPLTALTGALAEGAPPGTVGDFLDALPAIISEAGMLSDAEVQRGMLDDTRGRARVELALTYLGVGTRRWAAYTGATDVPSPVARDADVLFGFQGPPDGYHASEELSPQWTYRRFEEWRERSLRDFVVHLADVLLARHQRVALTRSTWRNGSLRVPIRLEIVDGIVVHRFGDSSGYPSLRLSRLLSMARQVGIFEVDEGGRLRRGPRGGLLD